MMDETPWASEPEAVAEAEVFAAAEDEQATGDAIPMAATHAESPFEEPVADLGYSADAFAIEQPEAMHIESMPLTAELPSEVMPEAFEPEPEAEPADFFAPAAEPEPEPEPVMEIGLASDMPFPITAEFPPPAADDFSKTITMADLYAKQGLVDEARDIYEDILARDPNNEGVRAKLDALHGDVAQTLLSVPEVEPEPESEPEPEYEAAQTGMSVPQTSKIARLEGWLAKMARRDIGGV
jgi:pentatricopeptide repeat protein